MKFGLGSRAALSSSSLVQSLCSKLLLQNRDAFRRPVAPEDPNRRMQSKFFSRAGLIRRVRPSPNLSFHVGFVTHKHVSKV